MRAATATMVRRTITVTGMLTGTSMAPAAATTTRTSTTTTPTMGTPTNMADRGLATLLCWLSPAFPVGAYAYSHGLEWAVEAGDARAQASLAGWIGDILERGAGRNDAILLAAAHRAAAAQDGAGLADANELALALAPSAELRLETAQQGRSFLDAALAAWPEPRLAVLAEPFGEIAYPVALGMAASCHDVPIGAAIQGHLTAFAGNLVSAAIRLAPIGQTAGQRVLAGLAPLLGALASTVEELGLDDLGSPTFRADLGSFQHETQYTRLFRS